MNDHPLVSKVLSCSLKLNIVTWRLLPCKSQYLNVDKLVYNSKSLPDESNLLFLIIATCLLNDTDIFCSAAD